MCGCSTLSNQESVIADIEKNVPNAKFVTVNKDDESATYIFDNGEFQFEYTETYNDEYNWIDKNDTYIEQIILKHQDEIKTIIDKYDITVLDQDAFSVEYLPAIKLFDDETIPAIQLYNKNSSAYATLFINNNEDIAMLSELVDEIVQIFNKYMMSGRSDYVKPMLWFSVYNNTPFKTERNPYILYSGHCYLVDGEVDVAYESDFAEYQYKCYVNSGLIDGSFYSDCIPPAITRLQINGTDFISQQYDMNFLYNPHDENYYVLVAYGTDTAFMPKDSIQREIITRFYKKSKYVIDDDRSITQYNINSDNFKIYLKSDDGLFGDRYWCFEKNGQVLDVDVLDRFGDSYLYSDKIIISIDDFAMLMNMEVEDIDIYNQIIKLKTIE